MHSALQMKKKWCSQIFKSNQFGKLQLEAPNWSTTALEKFQKMLTSTICTALLDFRAYSVIAGRIHINVQKNDHNT